MSFPAQGKFADDVDLERQLQEELRRRGLHSTHPTSYPVGGSVAPPRQGTTPSPYGANPYGRPPQSHPTLVPFLGTTPYKVGESSSSPLAELYSAHQQQKQVIQHSAGAYPAAPSYAYPMQPPQSQSQSQDMSEYAKAQREIAVMRAAFERERTNKIKRQFGGTPDRGPIWGASVKSPQKRSPLDRSMFEKKKETAVLGKDVEGKTIVEDRGSTWYMGSVSLGVEDDKYWLSELQVYLRSQFAEAFAASEDDIAAPMHGRNKPIALGQVGIRCIHCKGTCVASIENQLCWRIMKLTFLRFQKIILPNGASRQFRTRA